MRWAAVVLGAIALVATSCWRGRPQGAALENRAAASERDLTAAYFCSIQDGGHRYPPYPCAVRKIDGRWLLAKLAGSQRFRGEVRPRGEGFSFAGELYCPWGDCAQPLHGVFESLGEGRLRGRFRDARFVVLLEPAPDTAFGGVGYGGDGYGGFGYGGHGDGAISPGRSNRQP